MPENTRPGAQARKSPILNKKSIGKHRCQEEGPDPGKWPPRRPGILSSRFLFLSPIMPLALGGVGRHREVLGKYLGSTWEGPPCIIERARRAGKVDASRRQPLQGKGSQSYAVGRPALHN